MLQLYFVPCRVLKVACSQYVSAQRTYVRNCCHQCPLLLEDLMGNCRCCRQANRRCTIVATASFPYAHFVTLISVSLGRRVDVHGPARPPTSWKPSALSFKVLLFFLLQASVRTLCAYYYRRRRSLIRLNSIGIARTTAESRLSHV